jgi:FAD/FMN-containing dehydrogenase/Fe-S oxidoreductase
VSQDTAAAIAALGADFELDDSALARALYSSDASLQRVVPAAVARPSSVGELNSLVEAALTAGVAITSRGAGTSIAGNAIGPGLVIDLRRLNRIAHIDTAGQAAIVEPGVIPADLNRAAAVHGLRFGPDPSTVDRCTIGGMIGNNACGARALGFGRTADNLLGVEAITGTGEHLILPQPTASSPTLQALHRLVQDNLAVIRTEFGRFTRQVSGYSLEHLLPENGFNVARFLAGSEGTLAVVTGARVRLVPEPAHTTLIAIGYPDMATAAEAMPAVLEFSPTAAEGLDRRIVEVVARRGGVVPPLPRGEGWLLIELADDDPRALARRATELLAAAGGIDGEIITDPARVAALWRIRADGAGLAAVGLERPAHSGWEDSAVPPAALGAYLRALDALMARHGLHGLPYGHFGEGCVHLRIDFELSRPEGVAGYRRFVEVAAELVAGFGGSISGEHGDGRARSELLARQYSPAAVRLFSQVKAIFDPHNLLNPGVLVDPEPLDANLRLPHAADAGLPAIFVDGVHRCTGVAKCLTVGEVMCPSYQATGREQDSTRGRARVLQEVANGSLSADSPAVTAAMELCLGCKACARECPTGTDIATAKSLILEQRGARPSVLSRLPDWAPRVSVVPGLPGVINAFSPMVKAVAGIDRRRSVPVLTRPVRRRRSAGTGEPVAIWVDPFTKALDSVRVEAVLDVLTHPGRAPRVLRQRIDTGVTLISAGQRKRAAATLRRAIEVLHPIVASGVPVVGLDPSAVAVWRSDAADLIDDPRLEAVVARVHTLAEFLTGLPDWTPPDLSGLTVVAQPHCHHRAVLGWQTDAALLARTGAKVISVDGCCGMAGDFGMTHYDISVSIAQNSLLPAIEAAGEDAVLLADGFSCRYQILDLTGRSSSTLAQLLARTSSSH